MQCNDGTLHTSKGNQFVKNLSNNAEPRMFRSADRSRVDEIAPDLSQEITVDGV